MLSAFVNSFKIQELRQRLLFTFALVFICRIVASIPVPGIDAGALRDMIAASGATQQGGFLNILNLFTGGALSNFAVGALGIMPYISASIIIQLMTAVVPTLERLAREGDSGRQKITQITRYLTVALCLVQGFAMSKTFLNPQALGLSGDMVFISPGLFLFLSVITMTAATLLLMWLGEQITDRGIGNGVSLIITIGIIASLPGALGQAYNMFFKGSQYNVFHAIAMLLTFFLVTAGTVAITQAVRKIPIQHAKRMVGRKMYGGQATHLPLRVNYAGVMPIIFAQSILMFPGPLLGKIDAAWAKKAAAMLSMNSPVYIIIYALMILFFSYFWVATQFKPPQIADDLRRNGAFVPGIRPGKPTADYLDRLMTRITMAGALFLTCIAVLPILLNAKFGIPYLVAQFFGGTSMLIMVGVMLDTMRQIETHLLTRHYDGFLKKGKLRSRR
jgi:preprotein translocase subunit SecY